MWRIALFLFPLTLLAQPQQGGGPFSISGSGGISVNAGTNVVLATNGSLVTINSPTNGLFITALGPGAGTAGLSNITTTGASLGTAGQLVETVVPSAGTYFFETVLGFMYSNTVFANQQVIILNYTNVQQASAGGIVTIPLPLINNHTGGVAFTFPYVVNCAASDTIRIHGRLSGNPTSGNIYFTNFYHVAIRIR